MELPSWLNEDFVSNALGGKYVKSIDVKRAVPIGNNYLSQLIRVKVNFGETNEDKENSTSIIIKSLPLGFLGTFVTENGLMNKEVAMYYEYLPVMTKIVGRQLSPKCFKSSRNDVLVLEDLALTGYKMQDRIKGLDIHHAEAVLKGLADFHAASISIKMSQPKMIEKVSEEGQFQEKNLFERDFFENRFNIFIEQMKCQPDFRHYCERWNGVFKKIWDSILNFLNDDKLFKVLNHGDLWINNILFQYNSDGKIKNVNFIDFQFCRWTTPAMDLQAFFLSGVSNRSEIPHLIRFYLSQLNKRLPSSDKLTLEHLEEALKRTECYSFLNTTSLLPMAVISPENACDYSTTTEEDFRNSVNENPQAYTYRDPNYLKLLPALIDHYEKSGLF